MARNLITHIKTWLGLGYYTSSLDQFLTRFDAAHPILSSSQRELVEKYTLIFAKRDGKTPAQQEPRHALWEKF